MSTKINPCRAGQDGKFDIIILGDIKDASVFHIGHDGATIYLLSNNKTCSTLEGAMAKMPTVMLEEIEEFDYDYRVYSFLRVREKNTTIVSHHFFSIHNANINLTIEFPKAVAPLLNKETVYVISYKDKVTVHIDQNYRFWDNCVYEGLTHLNDLMPNK